MITTTLNRIREHSPCAEGWEKLLKHLGKTKADDEPLPFSVILESNGLDDALWCCRAEPQYAREWRLYAVWCARQVQRLMTDQRSLAAVAVAERYAHGDAPAAELDAARYAARYAAGDAAWDAAKDAAGRYAAGAAAGAAAGDAARYAAGTAAWDAAGAAAVAAAGAAAWDAAWYAAWDAAGAAAWAAARDAQSTEFKRIISQEN